ncbi:hypothetical protein [Pseudomonas sp. Marseille-Q5115]|uniref:hypothetical protein n=1 Tax=Pseudomonas sp. Marseille-Q5115 TaxID=2866593 RepID=UPI001CE43DBB|nr:hypothetical protein [Pseudomonas sp. Marseille-Q5115]
MKRYLRFCLLFLISIALPLTGMAGVQALTEPCPMKTMGMAMVDDMGMDCCSEMKSPADHGKPCKPGQECKTSGMLETSVFKPPVTPVSSVSVALASDPSPIQAPSGVWRPPRI